MNFVRQVCSRHVAGSVWLGGRQLRRNTSNYARPSLSQDWRMLSLYLSVPVAGYFGIRYWVGESGSPKNVVTLFLESLAGDILTKSDEIMEEHLTRMQIKHERHVQDMKVQKSGDLYVRQPIRVGGHNIAKNQARDVIDSGIDY